MKIFEGKVVYKAVGIAESIKLDTPDKAFNYAKPIVDQPYEGVWVLPMDRKNRCRGAIQVTEGAMSQCLFPVAKIIRTVLMAGCETFIVVHNHPSGNPAPSQADAIATRQLQTGAKACEVTLLDHVIIGEPSLDPTGLGYYSFRVAGIVG